LRFVLVALPVSFATCGFVVARFHFGNPHHIKERDVHDLKSMPIATSRGGEADKETKLPGTVVDEQEGFVRKPIAVEIPSYH